MLWYAMLCYAMLRYATLWYGMVGCGPTHAMVTLHNFNTEIVKMLAHQKTQQLLPLVFSLLFHSPCFLTGAVP